MMETEFSEPVVVVSSEQFEAIRLFLAELEWRWGDLLSVPWVVA